MNRIFHIALMVLLTVAVSGCLKSAPKDEAVTIRIIGDGDEKSFYYNYGSDFNAKYPDIQLDFVSYQTMEQGQTIEQFVSANHPDILIASSELSYRRLSNDGLLMALDPLIKRDRYDTSTISTAVIDLLRSTDDDKLYGLSPYFNNNAIFYNEDLFRNRNIPIPQDNMTWEDLLRLAERFTDDSEMDGLSLNMSSMSSSINSLASLFVQMGNAQGLKLGAVKSQELLIGSDSWKKIAESIVESHQSGAIYAYNNTNVLLPPDEAVRQSRFATGKSAMTIGDISMMSVVDRTVFPVDDVKPIHYGMVKVPVDPIRPDIGLNNHLELVLCIYSKTKHKDAAWEFVKYMNSEDYAKLKSKSTFYRLLSRTQQMKEFAGKSLEAFYSQHADPDVDVYSGLQPQVYRAILQIIDRNLIAASKKGKTVEEALADAASEGNKLIREFAQSEANPK